MPTAARPGLQAAPPGYLRNDPSMSGPVTNTGGWQNWWEKTGSQPPITDDTPPPPPNAFPLRSVPPNRAPLPSAARGPDPAAGRGRRRAGRKGRADDPADSFDDLRAPDQRRRREVEPAPLAGRRAHGTGGQHGGATRADLARPADPRPADPRGLSDSGTSLGRPGGRSADPRGLSDSGTSLGRPAGRADTGTGLGRLGPAAQARPGDPRPTDSSSGLGRLAGRPGDPRGPGGPRGLADPRGLVDPRGLADSSSGLGRLAGPPGDPRGLVDPRSLGEPRGLADPRGLAGSSSGLGRLAGRPGDPRSLTDSSTNLARPAGRPGELGTAVHPLGPPADLGGPGGVDPPTGTGHRRRAAEDSRSARRGGATRADLVMGSTALQRQAETPPPDEITDTGARRARSAFHVAEEPEPYDEPSLVLQWGVFLLQTLTAAAVGLGVWLGFFRLWSTWPFYAAPAVGVAMIGMLTLARVLRRRYGHELDLLTAIVTIAVGTVLTVLPAAFTLQSIA